MSSYMLLTLLLLLTSICSGQDCLKNGEDCYSKEEKCCGVCSWKAISSDGTFPQIRKVCSPNTNTDQWHGWTSNMTWNETDNQSNDDASDEKEREQVSQRGTRGHRGWGRAGRQTLLLGRIFHEQRNTLGANTNTHMYTDTNTLLLQIHSMQPLKPIKLAICTECKE